ncbi:MAG: phenylacetate--CoA ligase [Paludibacteraceae bacterium]|jgi:phenylacetate-CoA ligase|nr:phenylacetate--CoA ligase [Paludibacteraceae bacterium]MDI9537051.1 phenylacetate--CoA ligase [Bacteroidota bacterium]OQC33907.1 MAG: Phenylacetate-coenzyme A ligase [Bacteroidetes bacterium ADurb.Bin057]HHT61147.1 phenylacetate--CoA ligase [Bacteroidales bacterium]MBP9039416.1 phenylacetate--CoA ligase [Paludibacteraceae bacterium]
MIWNEYIECSSRDAIIERQNKGLRKMVERLYFNVPFYRKKFQEMELSPYDIKGIEDLHKLPFTYKQDLRDNYPMGLFAVPQSEIVRLHASSGTTGKQTVVGYTRKDLDMWSEVVARCLSSAGVVHKDIVQIAYGYGLFTGGLGLHYGTEKIGASVIPISGGNTHRQLQTMQDLGSTVLACTPSYALYLAESLEKSGITKDQIKLRVGIFGAESWTDEMRRELEKKLGIKAFDIYGLSEIMGPGVACECECQNGLHVNEDHFIPEIIDPITLEPLPEGQEGELVFTTITKEGLPLLRYRTRDLSTLHYGTCSCGRTLVRMEKCKGRTDDMLIIRGVNVFPSQIESVLLSMHETSPHYQLIVERINNLDILEVHVEMDEHFFADEIRKIEGLNKRIKHNIENTLGISVTIKLVEPNTIERSENKAKRIIDNRKK